MPEADTAEKEVFLQAVDAYGFAPTRAAVHPETGDLGRFAWRPRHPRCRLPHPLPRRSEKFPEGRGALAEAPRCARLAPGTLQKLPRQATAIDALERLRARNHLYRHRQHFEAATVGKAIAPTGDRPTASCVRRPLA